MIYSLKEKKFKIKNQENFTKKKETKNRKYFLNISYLDGKII